MGHKVHPVGFRLGIIKTWDSKWYSDRHFVTYLQEDLKVRKAVRSMYPEAGVSLVEIDRQANNVSLTIHTARPGILIGRGGQRVDEMRKSLENLISKKIQLNIREVQQPEFDAYLVAKSIAESMERRVSYRRALKQALQRSIMAGAKGMRIRAAGRLDGAEIARTITMHEGRVPLHTLRADIDYGFAEAKTVMGRIGIKVWIYKGEILPVKEEAEIAEVAGVAEVAAQPAVAQPAVTPTVGLKTEAPVEQSSSEASTEKITAVREEATNALAEKHTVRRIRKPAAEKTSESVETPAAPIEEIKAAKPTVRRTRKPAAEKVKEAVSEVETEEKHTTKKTGPASGISKPKTVKAKKTSSDVTEEPTAEK
jgi:small subunit ribosomal protein S3